MQGSLTLSEALNRLEDGAYHSVCYVSYDARRKEAGRIIRIPECRIIRHQKTTASAPPSSSHTTKQRHSLHATRNLSLPNGLVRKMHIHLLAYLDNQTVL